MKCKLVSATDKKTNEERLIRGERITSIGKIGTLEPIGDLTENGSMFLFTDVHGRYLRTSRGNWRKEENQFILDTYNSIYVFEELSEDETVQG